MAQKKTIAEQIVTDLTTEHGSLEKARSAAQQQVRKMDPINAHLWHWLKAVKILDARI